MKHTTRVAARMRCDPDPDPARSDNQPTSDAPCDLPLPFPRRMPGAERDGPGISSPDGADEPSSLMHRHGQRE